MMRWDRARSGAWESLVIASFVSVAFFAFFDPRLQFAEGPVPSWLSNWPLTYLAGFFVAWCLTALIFAAHVLLKSDGFGDVLLSRHRP